MNLLFAALLIGAVYISIKWRFREDVQPRRGSRADGEAYYLQVRKEMGIDPYSPVELAQMEAEERYTHDRNAHAAAALSDVWDATWIDSYGNVREL